MQYPPQEQPPTNQPYYPPSEIYQYDQPQQFAPAREMSRLPVQRQDIVVYPNRGQAIWRTVVCVVCLLFLLIFIPVFSINLFATAGPIPTDEMLPIVSLLVFVFVLFLAALIFLGWITWRMASALLFKSKPILTITSEGITVGRMPMLSGFSILWSEIDAIFVSRYLYKYLCIQPKNADQFLSRFNGLERFNRRINSMIGAPLYVPLVFLDRPVEEILQQLYYMYASELNDYHVQLRS
jgi:TRAP-type C4-dicarboxylate transport system permease small subunit